MRRTRVIPSLLLKRRGFYKTTQFKKPVYLGDPINILKIFNDKEVDEICVLDIGATAENTGPQLEYIGDFASECFMPLAYGGGITSMDQIHQIFKIGFEKCIINTAFHENPDLVKQAAKEFGSQSIVVSLDLKKKFLGGYQTYSNCGTRKMGGDPQDVIRKAEDCGAGEILLNAMDRDGMMTGYDLDLAEALCGLVSVPVILCGGAGSVADLSKAVLVGASAVAAGAFFVFTGPHRAVLINVPSSSELEKALP